MNTTELRTKAKDMIDMLFNDVDELKIKSEQIAHDLKDEWNQEISNLENTKDQLKDIYGKISKANEASMQELSAAFDEQKASAEKRIDHLREIYSKMLN